MEVGNDKLLLVALIIHGYRFCEPRVFPVKKIFPKKVFLISLTVDWLMLKKNVSFEIFLKILHVIIENTL